MSLAQLELSLRDDTAIASPACVRTAGDHQHAAREKVVAGFSRKQAYQNWRQSRARYRKAQKAHHGQRAARKALVQATADWLRA